MNWFAKLLWAFVRFVLEKLRIFYLFYLNCGKFRNRNLECVSASREISKAPLSIYEGIGVGVYEKEFVVIRKWVGGTDNHQMVVYKLLRQDLDDIPEELIVKLYCLLCFLAAKSQRTCSTKTDFRKTNGLKLEPCPDGHAVSQCPIYSLLN